MLEGPFVSWCHPASGCWKSPTPTTCDERQSGLLPSPPAPAALRSPHIAPEHLPCAPPPPAAAAAALLFNPQTPTMKLQECLCACKRDDSRRGARARVTRAFDQQRRGRGGGGGGGAAWHPPPPPRAGPHSRELLPTASNMRSYQPPMRVCIMRSLKVSVPTTLRQTPNTARSARLGWAPPMKGRPPSASTHLLASCVRAPQRTGREGGWLACKPAGATPALAVRVNASCDAARTSSHARPPSHLVEGVTHVALHVILFAQPPAHAPHHRRPHHARWAGEEEGARAREAVRRWCEGRAPSPAPPPIIAH